MVFSNVQIAEIKEVLIRVLNQNGPWGGMKAEVKVTLVNVVGMHLTNKQAGIRTVCPTCLGSGKPEGEL